MPVIDGLWVPPSAIIAEIGITAYMAKYEEHEDTMPVTKRIRIKTTPEVKEEKMSVPIDAREGFTFGADPELFVFRNGEAVTAEGLIPGTKAKPYEVKDGVFVQVDGMAAEFNIPPAKTFKDFNHSIDSAIKQLDAMLPKGHELRVIPAVTFGEDAFNAASDKSKELGCSPDYNAWTGQVNPPPKAANPFLRTAAGHLHIGWTEDAGLHDRQHVMNCCDLVKQFDWFLGGWSVKVDDDPTRRSLYGKAGACRIKPYGVEYRVLSNFWITSRDRRLAVWNRMQRAIESISKAYYPDKSRQFNELLQKSINTSKLDRALTQHYPYPLLTMEGM